MYFLSFSDILFFSMTNNGAPDIEPLVSLLDIKINILEKLIGEVKKTEAGCTTFLSMLESRVKAQTAIILELNSCVQSKLDKSDPYVAAFTNELTEEVKLHTFFRDKLKNEYDEYKNNVGKSNNTKLLKVMLDLQNSLNGVKRKLKDSHERYQKNLNVDKFNAAFDKIAREASKTVEEFDTKIFDIIRNFKSQVTDSGNHTHSLSFRLASMGKIFASEIDRISTEYQDQLTLYDPISSCDNFCRDLFSNSAASRRAKDSIAYAISDFKSNSPCDLVLETGDCIKITRKDKSGWWQGELKGRKGFFPETYVCQDFDGIESVDAMFMCRQDYKATDLGSYIDLLMGDIVYLETFVFSGGGHKCSGTNLRTGKRGYFPLECIETGGYIETLDKVVDRAN